MTADRQLTIRRVLERWDLTRDGGIGQLAEAIDEAIEVPLEPAQVDAALVGRVSDAVTSAMGDAFGASEMAGDSDASHISGAASKRVASAAMAALRSRPAVVDAEVMAIIEAIETGIPKGATDVTIDTRSLYKLSAALRSLVGRKA